MIVVTIPRLAAKPIVAKPNVDCISLGFTCDRNCHFSVQHKGQLQVQVVKYYGHNFWGCPLWMAASSQNVIVAPFLRSYYGKKILEP